MFGFTIVRKSELDGFRTANRYLSDKLARRRSERLQEQAERRQEQAEHRQQQAEHAGMTASAVERADRAEAQLDRVAFERDAARAQILTLQLELLAALRYISPCGGA
jgi:hypothetical protein